MNNKILIIGGDPNSVNSEIIYKTWSKLDFKVKKKIYLIANFELLRKQFKKIKSKVKIIKVKSIKENSSTKFLKIIDIPLKFKDPFNTYVINGLPPKPISYVGRKTIELIMENYKTNYLFYFYNELEKKHIFSENYKNHVKKLN